MTGRPGPSYWALATVGPAGHSVPAPPGGNRPGHDLSLGVRLPSPILPDGQLPVIIIKSDEVTSEKRHLQGRGSRISSTVE